ncbi:putative E3 ubiquitin-protein ligase MYCBP2-like, partial [Tropilaelaps mercedesae]
KGAVAGGGLDQGLQLVDHRAFLELRPNPSPFAVFAAIRGCLQAAERRAGAADKSALHVKAEADSALPDNIIDDKKISAPLPRLVVMGIYGMLDVIRESCQEHPDLCARALRGLFDTLQGLAPEAMRNEPRETIDKLFSLMLELSSMEGVTPALSSLSSACLISLAIASGETAKLLAAANCLLLSPPNNGAQNRILATPLILIGLQRSIHSMLLGAVGRPLPHWFHLGLPSMPITSFQVDLPPEVDTGKDSRRRDTSCALASDGRFLFLLQAGVLYKISNGFGDSIEGNVLVMNRHLGRAESVVWIGVVADDLVGIAIGPDVDGEVAGKSAIRKWTVYALILDKDTLQVTRRIALPGGTTIPLKNTLFSDGQAISSIVPHDDVFSVQTIFRSSPVVEDATESTRTNGIFSAPVPGGTCTGDTLLKLTKKSMLVYGYGVIADISKGDLGGKQAQPLSGGGGQQLQSKASCALQQDDSKAPIVLSAVLDSGSDVEEADIVACGKDFALVRGTAGTVWAAGRVVALGIKQSTERWPDISLQARKLAVGHDGSHAVFLAPDGAVWFAGTARRGEDGDPVKGKRQPKTTKPR